MRLSTAGRATSVAAEPPVSSTAREQLSAVVLSNASLSAAEKAALVLELSRQTAGPDPLRVIRPKTR